MIELHHVHKAFTNGNITTPVLHDISFSIDAGEFVAIVGASGSGKSTLMHILGLLDQPTSGEYRLNQARTVDFSSDQLASMRNQDIGFVFQNFSLLSAYPVWYNVLLPLQYRQPSVPMDKSLAVDYLAKVGLADYADHYPSMLSGGQKQRVACARALIVEPKVVLADEPTGALDSVSSGQVLHLFQDLHRSLGVTLIIVTHDMAVAERADRQICLADGAIISDSRYDI